ncbi:DUF2182 domain-containing protein [Arthrobacter sunyaminii]|uniref:DUF2182 domain-containing protein n=1 Tax=Arthrobacter sunyaminii TaxID=2816859 RepID=A0A975S678_9MICC|nr:DUF2182 domain-containing protein [Arthrobacter sunyaminii]MBO0909760.1 DUF2182 domain-containing protein [Arthrobacter sunyaminii]QWQ36555.1 DUF2182 domain-containing protein [Arthrobacter sunyaminii]
MTPTSPAAPHQSGASRPLDMNLLVLSTIVMAAMAWGVLLLTHGPGGHGQEGHTVTSEVLTPGPAAETHAQHGGTAAFVIPPALVGGAVALGGWGFMVVAMMLPPALPLLQTVRRLASHRPDPWRLTIWSAMTFIGAWMVIGAVLVAGDLGVRALASSGWPAIDPRWVTGAVLIGAGGYQFTPLKDLCLRGCRSPRSFVLAHWQGRRSASAEIFALSGAYALSCIGCCWALMLICFTVGTAALPAMVALSVVMAAERLVPWGRRLVWPTGFALIAMGAATALIPAFDSPI